jgi:hypothetical protein
LRKARFEIVEPNRKIEIEQPVRFGRKLFVINACPRATAFQSMWRWDSPRICANAGEIIALSEPSASWIAPERAVSVGKRCSPAGFGYTT